MNKLQMRRVIGFFKTKPFLTVLVVFLVWITLTTIKPGFYLMGWDNYSSYFNLNNSIFRTLFATWREYRGLGVPSDAESTDLFRLLFDWIFHFFVPEGWLDQIYYATALWVGVLSMYSLMKEILENHLGNKGSWWQVDMISGMAGWLYLFNLNTLSVFYSPMIPFTNRYYALPLTLWAVLRFVQVKTKKSLIALVLIVLVGSGSFVTPTVLITTIIALGLFWLFQLGFKKTMLFGIGYVLLNSFWILPFVNYSLQKSSIVPLARTFVEINESTLNRPGSIFSLEKQAELYPSFLDMSFPSINRVSEAIHPLLKDYESGVGKWTLLAYPILYTLGCALIVFGWKKYKKIWWIPVWIGLFLFLSCKEFGVAGFAYIWLKEHVPFFEILFRISDTKFHAYISLAGSIAGAFVLGNIVILLSRKKFLLPIVGIILIAMGWYQWNFRTYFNGNLIGYYAYTQLPKAYQDIATLVNKDKGEGRLLHLPMSSQHHYWRSFSWGYLGSAFFDFMITRPYIDKTFEPGSMENAYLHSKINILLDSQYETASEVQKNEEAEKFVYLLNVAGVKYTMVDHSITSEVTTRDIYYNTKQYEVRAGSMLIRLVKLGKAKKVGTYPISLSDLYPAYSTLYPVNKTKLPANLPKDTSIDLYEIVGQKPMFEFTSQATVMDNNLPNLAETELLDSGSVLMQGEEPGVLMPFLNQNNKVEIKNDVTSLSYKTENTEYEVTTKNGETSSSYMIDVFAKSTDKNLVLSFYHNYLPTLNGKIFRQYIGDLEFTLSKKPIVSSVGTWVGDQDVGNKGIVDNYRIKVGDYYLAMPSSILEEEPAYIGSYVAHQPVFKVSLLEKTKEDIMKNQDIFETSPLPCFGPMLDGYEGKVDHGDNGVTISSKHGSACVASKITTKANYMELSVSMRGEVARDGKKAERLVSQTLEDRGENLMHAYICAQQGEMEGCLNNHRHLHVGSVETVYRIPLIGNLTSEVPVYPKFGSIPDSNNRQTLILNNLKTIQFSEKMSKALSFTPVFTKVKVKLSGKLTIDMPKSLGQSSYYQNDKTDLYAIPQEPCRRGDQRTTKLLKQVLVNDMESCSVYMAQPFSYNGKYAYLFSFNYWLGSGQQPVIVIGKEGDDYLVERASLYQGYPYLSQKELQDPEDKASTTEITDKLDHLKLIGASRLLAPDVRMDNSIVEANAHIFQDTDNEGVLGVSGFRMMEYPLSWYNLQLIPKNSVKTYQVPKGLNYHQILPSVWRVSVNQQNRGKSLLMFRQAYDKQWGVYPNIWSVLINKTKAVNNKCNGLFNCFELDIENGEQSYWIVYWPEVLSLAGWTATIGTASLLTVLWKKSKKLAAK